MFKIFKAYISYKLFTLIIAIVLVAWAYNKYQYMFQFTFKMLKGIS